jgi:TolA-binding protein
VRLALLLVVLALDGTGCATSVRRSMPVSAREWLVTLEAAQRAAAQGRYDDADRALSTYAQRYAGSPEAREAVYWRAVFQLDPANPGRNPASADAHLAEYLSDTAGVLHRTEALTLRRLASTLDSLNRAHQTVIAADTQHADDAARAQQREQELEKEIQRLKDQLEKTTQELERIKKRLAGKTP